MRINTAPPPQQAARVAELEETKGKGNGSEHEETKGGDQQQQRQQQSTTTAASTVSAEPSTYYHGGLNPLSTEELAVILSHHGIETSGYGQGKAKTLGHLLKEIQNGESSLQSMNSQLSRVTNVVSIRLLFSGHVLVQRSQKLEDGRVRSKGSLVAEKMLPDESREAAVRRGLQEELGLEAQNFTIESRTWLTSVLTQESPSFPGLASKYYVSQVDVTIHVQVGCLGAFASLGIDGDSIAKYEFETTEAKSDGKFITNHWQWVPHSELNPHINLPPMQMDTALLDQDPVLHPVRDVVERMIMEFYKQKYKEGRIARLEVSLSVTLSVSSTVIFLLPLALRWNKKPGALAGLLLCSSSPSTRMARSWNPGSDSYEAQKCIRIELNRPDFE